MMIKRSCLCVAMMLALASAPPVLAQTTARHAVEIQAQDLGTALKLLAQKMKIQIVYSADLVQGKQAPALNGSLTLAEALNHLLKGSGLKYEFLDAQTVTLSRTGNAKPSAPTTTPTSQTQPATYDFDIPSQDLDSALKAFTKISGQEVVFNRALVRGKVSVLLQGTHTVDEGIEILLEQTGLAARRNSQGTLLLEEEKNPFGASDVQKEITTFDKIVVTGTNVRGVEPAGQKLITIDRREIEQSGFTTAQDIVRSLPQNFTGNVQETAFLPVGGHQQSAGNTSRASAPNLRGLGVDSTLVLVNGRRIAPGGTRAVISDVSTIPVAAIERVEILPDGASALYGADAVGGVINFILRNDYDGDETRVRFGSVTNGTQQEHQLSQTFGRSWQRGNALLSFDYYNRDALPSEERSRTAGDLRPYGGSDYRITRCNPGTLRIGTTTYAIPADQNGLDLDATALVAGTVNLCSPNDGKTFYPDEERWSAVGRISQDVTDHLNLFADGIYSEREVKTTIPNNNLTLTVFPSNPFYPDLANDIESVSVDYDFTEDLGPRHFKNSTKAWSLLVGTSWAIAPDWSVTAYAGSTGARERQVQTGTPDAIGLAFALADGNPATAFNPFGEGSNSNAEILENLRDSSISRFNVDSELWLANVTFNGSIMSLSGGELRVAAGVDLRDQSYDSETISERLISGTVSKSPASFNRRVNSAFGELFVPIYGESNGHAWLRRLEISLAGRYEQYSDFGGKFVPRIGATWSPINGVNIRASWAKSFKGPSLADLDETNNRSRIIDIADPSSSSGGSVVLLSFGNNRDLQPETATSWTAGFDVSPEAIPGLRFSTTYFSVAYNDRIGGPPNPGALVPSNGSTIVRDPSSPLRQTICSTTQFLGNESSILGDCLSANIDAIFDARLQNLASLRERGLDIDIGYEFDTAIGEFRQGLNASYIFEYSLRTTSAAPTERALNTEGDPLKLKLRGSLAWNRAGYSAAAYLNFANDYKDARFAQNRKIDSWTTIDLYASYRFSSRRRGFLDGTTMSFNVRNAFDRDPPFFNSGTSGGYDAANANFQGRFTSFELRKEW